MSESDVTLATVREMARLALLSNKINEIQEKNLKIYPFVFFNNVSSVELNYDFSKIGDVDFSSKDANINYDIKGVETRHLKVSYAIDVLELCPDQELAKRCQALEMAVHNLLWNNIQVSISLNGTQAFKSEKNG